jgi:hypothetical protein
MSEECLGISLKLRLFIYSTSAAGTGFIPLGAATILILLSFSEAFYKSGFFFPMTTFFLIGFLIFSSSMRFCSERI